MPTLNQRLDGTTRIEYTTKETAQLLRDALKAAFPRQRFSVRTDYASMYSAVDVKWTDGPTVPEVERITDRFSSKTFNGSDDSTHYHDQMVDGQRVHYSGWINTRRDLSPALLERALARFQIERASYGLPPADLVVVPNGSCPYIGGRDHSAEAGISPIGYQFKFRYCSDAVQSIAYHLRPNGCRVTLKA